MMNLLIELGNKQQWRYSEFYHPSHTAPVRELEKSLKYTCDMEARAKLIDIGSMAGMLCNKKDKGTVSSLVCRAMEGIKFYVT